MGYQLTWVVGGGILLSCVTMVDDFVIKSRVFMFLFQDVGGIPNFGVFPVPDWEKEVDFSPGVPVRTHPSWITLGGGVPLLTTPHLSAEQVIDGADFKVEDFTKLPVRDPEKFVSGQLHENVEKWQCVLDHMPGGGENVRRWLVDGVDIVQFFQHFKGNFKGESYDSDSPPKKYFQNAPICKRYVNFICEALCEKIASGSIHVLGRLGECTLPTLIMPLTVEPTKPRLCHDDRFINLWTKDNPFHLETLRDIHRLIGKDSYLISCDEKSGYDHVRLSKESQTYFGIQFGGYVMTYTTIPFGWKASPFIYQTIGMTVTSYLRNRSVVTTQYIDDRLGAANTQLGSSDKDTYEAAQKVAYVLLELLTRLGYTLALGKCSLTPRKCMRFLGFIIDCVEEAYRLPNDKKQKFAVLRETILESSEVGVKTLQRFAGKCVSMGLVVPGSRLFCREVNHAIAKCLRNARRVGIDEWLRQELLHWRFLDDWEGCSRWRSECHTQVELSTDSSLYKYGAVALVGGQRVVMGDYWETDDDRAIHLKEAEAVLKVLQALGNRLENRRVDLLVDNMAVLSVWENQGGRDRSLNQITKAIFFWVSRYNVDLRMQYVPSSENEADQPSRVCSFGDSTLTDVSWQRVESRYGPHTVDLMALDSNVQKSKEGLSLKHFTPYPTPQSSGVNIFVQEVGKEENPYVFSPFGLILPVLSFLEEQKVKGCTMIVPEMYPYPVWWPKLCRFSASNFCVGKKSELGVVKIPTKKGFVVDNRGLKWALYAHRLVF